MSRSGSVLAARFSVEIEKPSCAWSSTVREESRAAIRASYDLVASWFRARDLYSLRTLVKLRFRAFKV